MGCFLEKSVVDTITQDHEQTGTSSPRTNGKTCRPIGQSKRQSRGTRHAGIWVKRLSQRQGEDIRDKYSIGAVLGSGSFGQVREANFRFPPTKSVAKRAVKIIVRDGKEGEWSSAAMFRTEVALLQNIDDPNIVKCFDFYEDHSFLYVVMERCEGGEVFQKIRELRRFCEYDAAAIGKQMLSALAYIHRLHIAHRDIKAENFLFWTNDMSSPLKMIDFGMAAIVLPGQYLDALCGSPHYLSPELVGQKYNELTDIWAFGVLMYLMLFGRYPHSGKQPEEIMWQVLTSEISWTSDKVKISASAIRFLKHLIQPDWHARYSAEIALQHPWIHSYTEMKRNPSALPVADLPQEVREAAHNASKIRFTSPILPVHSFEQKLEQISRDYSKGARIGKRLSGDPKSKARSSEDLSCATSNRDKNSPEWNLRVNSLVGKVAHGAPHADMSRSVRKSTSLCVVKKASLDTVIPEDENLRAPSCTQPESMTKNEKMAILATKCAQSRTKPNSPIKAKNRLPKPLAQGCGNPHARFQVRAVSTPHMMYIGDLGAQKTSSFAEKYDQLFGGVHAKAENDKCTVLFEESDTECIGSPDSCIKESDSSLATNGDGDTDGKTEHNARENLGENRPIGAADRMDS